jgi:hypothetical protein
VVPNGRCQRRPSIPTRKQVEAVALISLHPQLSSPAFLIVEESELAVIELTLI